MGKNGRVHRTRGRERNEEKRRKRKVEDQVFGQVKFSKAWEGKEVKETMMTREQPRYIAHGVLGRGRRRFPGDLRNQFTSQHIRRQNLGKLGRLRHRRGTREVEEVEPKVKHMGYGMSRSVSA